MNRSESTVDDDDPMVDFQFSEIVRRTDIGLTLRIDGDVFWLPVRDVEWGQNTVSMPMSLAQGVGLIPEPN